MKFDMGADTLSTLQSSTSGSLSEMYRLVMQLRDAAEPLESKFKGNGKAAFAQFKSETDLIAAALQHAMSKINEGQAGMDVAFADGDSETEANARRAMGSQNFNAARF
ncbi:hypothetical protein HCJ92_22235 [Streptomyces sp. ventii]|uniref:WXG100 family type VII secretion target n=2 Tax=Streptomyces spiramenti TaxID=2720606 RepID=A0ABX1AVS5_9ACTN|nr:hypothetical protein [Streptomyces spiramenti]NJP68928.1 hypothetical protein [Streptomyces spiramenti]